MSTMSRKHTYAHQEELVCHRIFPTCASAFHRVISNFLLWSCRHTQQAGPGRLRVFQQKETLERDVSEYI